MEKYRRVVKKREAEVSNDEEIRVTAVGSVSAYISRAAKLFNEMEKSSLTITATGNALTKAVTAAEVIKRRFKGLHQVTKLLSQEITDEYEPLEEGLDKVTQTRQMAAIEITLSKDKLDTSDKGYQEPIDEDLVKDVDPEDLIKSRGGGRGGKGKGKSKGKSKSKSPEKGKGKGKGKRDDSPSPKGKGKSKSKDRDESPKGKGKGKSKGKGKNKYNDDYGGYKSDYKSDYKSYNDYDSYGGYSSSKGKGKSRSYGGYGGGDDWYGGGRGYDSYNAGGSYGYGKGKSNSGYSDYKGKGKSKKGRSSSWY